MVRRGVGPAGQSAGVEGRTQREGCAQLGRGAARWRRALSARPPACLQGAVAIRQPQRRPVGREGARGPPSTPPPSPPRAPHPAPTARGRGCSGRRRPWCSSRGGPCGRLGGGGRQQVRRLPRAPPTGHARPFAARRRRDFSRREQGKRRRPQVRSPPRRGRAGRRAHTRGRPGRSMVEEEAAAARSPAEPRGGVARCGRGAAQRGRGRLSSGVGGAGGLRPLPSARPLRPSARFRRGAASQTRGAALPQCRRRCGPRGFGPEPLGEFRGAPCPAGRGRRLSGCDRGQSAARDSFVSLQKAAVSRAAL